jgi:hypothetical protein
MFNFLLLSRFPGRDFWKGIEPQIKIIALPGFGSRNTICVYRGARLSLQTALLTCTSAYRQLASLFPS